MRYHWDMDNIMLYTDTTNTAGFMTSCLINLLALRLLCVTRKSLTPNPWRNAKLESYVTHSYLSTLIFAQSQTVKFDCSSSSLIQVFYVCLPI